MHLQYDLNKREWKQQQQGNKCVNWQSFLLLNFNVKEFWDNLIDVIQFTEDHHFFFQVANAFHFCINRIYTVTPRNISRKIIFRSKILSIFVVYVECWVDWFKTLDYTLEIHQVWRKKRSTTIFLWYIYIFYKYVWAALQFPHNTVGCSNKLDNWNR